MAGVGNLVQQLLRLTSWRGWLVKDRLAQIEAVVAELNQIDVVGRRIMEGQRVVKVIEERARAASDEELWKQEQIEGRQESYW